MASDEDKLFGLEIVEKEFVRRYEGRGYMTRDFFINQRHYRWTHNMEIGDGAIARYGVLQGWPIHEGAKRIKQTATERAAIVSQPTVSLAWDDIGDNGFHSPLVHNPGGVVRKVPKKPSLDSLS